MPDYIRDALEARDLTAAYEERPPHEQNDMAYHPSRRRKKGEKP